MLFRLHVDEPAVHLEEEYRTGVKTDREDEIFCPEIAVGKHHPEKKKSDGAGPDAVRAHKGRDNGPVYLKTREKIRMRERVSA